MAMPESSMQGLERHGAKSKEANITIRPDLRGASVLDEEKMEVACTLITEGPGNPLHRHWYTRKAVMEGAPIFEGSRCYLNHQTEQEEIERPEGDIRLLVGFYRQVKSMMEGGLAMMKAVLCVAATTAGKDLWAQIKHAIKYQETYPDTDKVYCGLSINAGGDTKEGEHDGEKWKDVVRFTIAEGADAVTVPARGGKFEAVMESLRESWKKNDSKGVNAMKKKALNSLIEECKAALTKVKEGDATALEEAFGKMQKMHDEMPDDKEEPAKEGAKPTEKAAESDKKPEEKPAEKTRETWKPPVVDVPPTKPAESPEKLAEAAKKADETAKLREENTGLKNEVFLLRSKESATALLRESKLPDTIRDNIFPTLIGQTEEAMRSTIKLEEARVESVKSVLRESYPSGPANTSTGMPQGGGDIVLNA